MASNAATPQRADPIPEANKDAAPAAGAPVISVNTVDTVMLSPFDKSGNVVSVGAGIDTFREEQPLNKFDQRPRRGSWMQRASVDRSMDNIAALAQLAEEKSTPQNSTNRFQAE